MEDPTVKKIVFAAAVCGSGLMATVSRHAQSQAAPRAGTPRPPAAARSQDQSPLADRVQTKLGESFQVNVVRVDGKSLQVVLNDREIPEDVYLKLVTTTCGSLGADARQLTDFGFANRFAMQGFSFKAPAKCVDILKASTDQQKKAILAATQPL